MAVTLMDYFRQSKDPTHKAFIADLLRASRLLEQVPFVPLPGLQVSATRWLTMPSVAFRKIGAGYTEGTGKTEQIEETLYALGGDVKIDKLLKGGNTFEDPLVTQMKMKAKAMAFKFNDQFINGDLTVDPDGFEGLKKRVSNMPTRQTIDLAQSTDSLKVLASTANTHLFLDGLAKAAQYVAGATHFFMNENTILQFEAALRRTSPALLTTVKDSWDREITAYKGIPMIDVGLLSDKSTEIITNTEDPGDAGNDATSLYAVRIDTDDGLCGLQKEGSTPEPYDPLGGAELESGPQYLRRIDWAVGLLNISNYCIARVKGFRMETS